MNIHDYLILAVQGQDLDMTIVAGKVLVGNIRLFAHDIKQFNADENESAPKLFKRCDQ